MFEPNTYKNKLLIFCFCLSGFSNLLYEIIWSKALAYALGITIYAQAATIAAFMAGLAFGSYLGAKLISKTKNNLLKQKPLLAFAICQLAIGFFGISYQIIFAPNSYNFVLMPEEYPTYISMLFRFLLLGAVIFVPCTLMGACFPTFVHGLGQNNTSNQRLNLVYTINTLGALLAIPISSLLLIPQLGLTGSSIFSGCLNILIAIFALSINKTKSQPIHFTNNSLPYVSPLIFSIAFCQGFITLALEIIWFRLFALVFGSSVYSFSCVLFLVLLGTSMGAALITYFVIDTKKAATLLAAVSFSSAFFIALGFCFYNQLPFLYFSLAKYFVDASTLTFWQALLSRLIPMSLIILPTTILLGTTLPLLFISTEIKSIASSAAKIYSFNTIGCIIGALAGFTFISVLGNIFPSGIASSITLIAALEFILGMIILSSQNTSFATTKIIALISLVTILFIPKNFNVGILSSGISFFTADNFRYVENDLMKALKPPLFYKEGLNSTVTVNLNKQQDIIYLANDGKVEAAVPIDAKKISNYSDYPTQTLLGLLPTIFHNGQIENTLLIGYGSGTTANALLQSSKLTNLHIIEIEPAVIEANKYFAKYNNDPLKSRQVTLFINDARYCLTTSKQNYDIIVSQPADPWVSGASALFTKEFWQLCKSRLTKEGIICQWLQLYSIDSKQLGQLLLTFQSVFPETYVFQPQNAGEIIMLGFKNSANIDFVKIDQKINEEAIKSELNKIGVDQKAQFISLMKLNPQQLNELTNRLYSGRQLNTDDNLALEFAQAKTILTGKQELEANLSLINSVHDKSKNIR